MKMADSTVAIATVAFASGLLHAAPASAATFQADFFVDIVSGDFLVRETFSGQLTYDDSLLTGVGTELLGPDSGLLSLSFEYVAADLTTPASYTEADDDIASGFPLVTFQAGALAGLDYSVAITQDLFLQFREEPLGSGEFGFFTDDFSTFGFNTGTIAFADPELLASDPESVPEPAILAGLVAIAMSVRRRQ